jgi:hypothetical protein
LWRRYKVSTACGEIPPDFKRRDSHLLSLKSPVGGLGRARGFFFFPSGRQKRKRLHSFIGNMSKLENFVKKILAGAAGLGSSSGWRKGCGRISDFYVLEAGKGLDDVEGLGDPAYLVVLILEGFDVLQGDLLAPDIPEDEIEIEDDDS